MPSSLFVNALLGTALFSLGLAIPASRRSSRRVRRRLLISAATCAILAVLVYWKNSTNTPRSTLRIPARLKARDKVKVFILAGQSNMAGRGGIVRKGESVRKIWDPTALTEEELQLSVARDNDRVVRLSAEFTWDVAVEPLHQDIDVKKSCGIGPGLIFARSLLAHEGSDTQIALVPCAVGGTKISEWSRGSVLYENMIRRATFAGQPVEALLWYQGESDCNSIDDAKLYHQRLREFVQNVRVDLKNSDLKIVMVAVWAAQIEHTLPFAEQYIRPSILSMAEEDRNIEVVDAKGLSFLDDNIHLTSASQFVLANSILGKYRHLLD